METFYRVIWLLFFTTIVVTYDKLDKAYPDVYAQETWIGLIASIVLVPSIFVMIINLTDFMLDDGSWRKGVSTSFSLVVLVASASVFIYSGASYGNCTVLFILTAFFVASTLGVIWNDWMNDMFMSLIFFAMIGPADKTGLSFISRAQKRWMRARKRQLRQQTNQQLRQEANHW